jgi:mannose-6-phosphate isomerase-like protein (cupin superfamily)
MMTVEQELRSKLQKFTARETPMLSAGHWTKTVSIATHLKMTMKVYSSGGENGLHRHPREDHSFFILQGEAAFWDEDGLETRVRAFEGIMIPKGTLYRFQSVSEENLVLLRSGGAVSPGDMAPDLRFAKTGELAHGSSPENLTGSEPAVPIPGKFFDPA